MPIPMALFHGLGILSVIASKHFIKATNLRAKTSMPCEKQGPLGPCFFTQDGEVGAYLLKEDFQRFWFYKSTCWAGKFLDDWCTRTMRSRIGPCSNFI